MRFLALMIAMGYSTAASAVDCVEQTHLGDSYTTCTIDMAREELRLFLNDTEGVPLHSFDAVDQALKPTGRHLVFAMNAGMYHRNRAPVGYYLEDGVEVMRVVPNAGPGNFGLLPNGVFCIADARADVIETLRFLANPPQCVHASQSGPMLVIEGALHPRFLVDSTSRYVRNGVGTRDDGTVAIFVISNNPVTFHAFGSFFRDVLGTPNALYFDGNVSRLHAPELGRSDLGRPMGPIVGVVESQP